MSYKFTTEVKAMKADGICELEYSRPTMTLVEGETAVRPPKTTVDKVNLKYLLTVSPINEILSVKDLQPSKPPKTTSGFRNANRTPLTFLQPAIGQFIGEVYRLALFVGGIDGSLDFNPKLPYDAVKVGDSWKRTVGYQPQKLGAGDKSAVQRLDYVYTYRGLVDVEGKQFQRVTAHLILDTDVGEYVNQIYGKERTGLKAIKLKLKATVAFDLDTKTFKTIRAIAESEGSISIEVVQLPNEPAQEERLKGRTTMTLVASK